ncbi:MAG: LPS export ABC transporter periplasmic protein LptC [Candidatus Competibacteraceae bacterium]
MSSVRYLTIVTVLALLSGWLLFTVESSLRKTAQQDQHVPALYIDKFQATRTNLQGFREYTLSAPHLVQLPDPQGTRVEQPTFEIFGDEQQREWLIHAERGWITADNQTIRLEDAVNLNRMADDDKPPLSISTRQVTIYPERAELQTDAPVLAEMPNGVISAIGLRAYWHEERMELLSDVRGSYVPLKPE